MNTEELRQIEAFRQRLEIRFQHERRVKRLKRVLGIVAVSAVAVSLPLLISAQLSHGTREAPLPMAPAKSQAMQTTPLNPDSLPAARP